MSLIIERNEGELMKRFHLVRQLLLDYYKIFDNGDRSQLESFYEENVKYTLKQFVSLLPDSRVEGTGFVTIDDSNSVEPWLQKFVTIDTDEKSVMIQSYVDQPQTQHILSSMLFDIVPVSETQTYVYLSGFFEKVEDLSVFYFTRVVECVSIRRGNIIIRNELVNVLPSQRDEIGNLKPPMPVGGNEMFSFVGEESVNKNMTLVDRQVRLTLLTKFAQDYKLKIQWAEKILQHCNWSRTEGETFFQENKSIVPIDGYTSLDKD